MKKKIYSIDIQSVAEPNIADTEYLGWAMRKGARGEEDAYSKAGMHAEYAFICAIAVSYVGDEGKPILVFSSIARSPAEETRVLENFIKFMGNEANSYDIHIGGHNVSQFDKPFIIKRLIANCFKVPAWLKYESNTIDIMKICAFGSPSMMPLRAIAHMLGCDTTRRNGNINKNVYNLFKDGNYSTIQSFAEDDSLISAMVIDTLIKAEAI